MEDYREGSFRICHDSGYCALDIGGDTYHNCVNGCLYCYEKQASNQILRDPRLQPRDFRALFNSLWEEPDVRELFLKTKLAVRIGVVSDPFPPLETEARNTLRLMRLLNGAGVQYQLTTKRPDVIDAEHIQAMREAPKAGVRVSFSTFDEGKARIIEPGSPPPAERLAQIKRLTDAGVEVGIRLAPFLHIEEYDYGVLAATGASNVTVEPLRFSLLWRHSTDPRLWEALSGEKAPEGDVVRKGTPARKWVEAKEKAFYAPLQNLKAHPYNSGGNLWVYSDPFRLRELWQRERDKAHAAGLQFGICSTGTGIHNIDLNDAPCGCLTPGWQYDPLALVPAWFKNQWADYIAPVLQEYEQDILLDRFLFANSWWNKPLALDGRRDIDRAAIMDAPVDIGTSRSTV